VTGNRYAAWCLDIPKTCALSLTNLGICHLLPTRGKWSKEDYLDLNGHQLVELSHGFLEVLPMRRLPK
jgi:hypothetical protein